MTLRQVNASLREVEIEEPESPTCRLCSLISILRALDTGKRATDNEIAASIEAFKEKFGPVTTENIDKFMEMSSEILDAELDNEWILEVT